MIDQNTILGAAAIIGGAVVLAGYWLREGLREFREAADRLAEQVRDIGISIDMAADRDEPEAS